MKRRDFIKTIAFGSVATALSGCTSVRIWPPGNKNEPSRPNIILLVADDLGWKGVGFHGSHIRTPNIDRIAEEGVQLDRFYVCPICTPTRAGLMTGRYPIRFGMMRSALPPWGKHGLPPQEETIAEMLARAGYKRRGCFGKWHLGHSNIKYHPLNQGFTEFYGCYNGAINYFTHVRNGQPDWHRNYQPANESGYSTDLIAAEAARFIDQSPPEEPFFAYVPFNAPHAPYHVTQEYKNRYPQLKGREQNYAGVVSALDDGVGKIIAALDKKGIRDNTLIWFLSDNGAAEPPYNAPLRKGKQTVYEGGIRVPAAVHWPAGGLVGPKKIKSITGYIDVHPTLKRIVNFQPHYGLPFDGIDIYDILRGKKREPLRPWFFYWHQNGPDERLAVILGDWKLIWVGPQFLKSAKRAEFREIQKHCSLFRIKDDPYEENDVSAQYPDTVKQLIEKLTAFRKLKPKDGIPQRSVGQKGFKPPKNWKIPDNGS